MPDPSLFSPPLTPWPFHRTIPIIYHDIDALNHLNHAAYFRFMETLRCDYYLPLLGHSDPTKLDIIVAEATCRYLAPVVYGQELLGELAPARPLGRTSFTLLYRFRSNLPNDPTVYARGRIVLVSFDYEKNRKKEIPADLRRLLEKDAIDQASEGWT
ncbi:MAG TPA: thioesterase family protein [Thermoplasmata archaeon]|nr:thioesterase family protein [Thermoplasmata archaeon]